MNREPTAQRKLRLESPAFRWVEDVKSWQDFLRVAPSRWSHRQCGD